MLMAASSLSACTTRRLRFAYIFAVVGVVLVFNLAAVLAWRLLFAQAPLPYGYLLVNTLATGGLIVAGTLLERHRLAEESVTIAGRRSCGQRAQTCGRSPTPRATR